MLDWKSLHQTISGAERILLSTHENPDGDGLGSAAAVYHYLNSQGKNCKIINISDLPLEYEFLNQNKMIETYNSLNHTDWISSADLALIFDVGDYSRLRIIGELLNQHKIHVVNIDHHPDNNLFGTINIVDDISSVGELLFHIFQSQDWDVSPEIATCLYAAISFDTGRFAFKSVTSKTFYTAASLVDMGAQPDKITQALDENRTTHDFELIKTAIDSLITNDEKKYAYCVIPKNAPKAKIKLIDFIRQLNGFEVYIIFQELKPNLTKINLRSKTYFNVSEFAKQFGGGGHKQAAGILIEKPVEEIKNELLDYLNTVL